MSVSRLHMRKKENKVNKKKDSILKAAAELFAGKSYHEVMMEDVAKIAGIAKGTVYLYFSSKEELYYSILCGYMDELITTLKEGINNSPGTVLSFKSYVTIVFNFLVKNKEFHLIFKKETLTNKNEKCSEVKKHTTTLKNLLTPILKQGMEEKIFEIAEIEFTSEILIGSIFAAAWPILSSAERSIETESYQLFSILIKSISNSCSLPLLNKNIVLVRGEQQANLSSGKFEEAGANVLIIPSISIKAINPDKLKRLLNSKVSYDLIVFSSANAVKIFFKFIKEKNLSINGETRIAVTGKKTAEELTKCGYKADYMPDTYCAAGLLDVLKKQNLEGKYVLVPKSAIGREELINGMKESGAHVFPVDVYDTVLPDQHCIDECKNKLNRFKADIFVFTSPSTFNNYIKMLNIKEANKYFKNNKIAVIGNTTQEALLSAGITPDLVPDEFTIEGIVNKIKEYYNGEKIEQN